MMIKARRCSTFDLMSDHEFAEHVRNANTLPKGPEIEERINRLRGPLYHEISEVFQRRSRENKPRAVNHVFGRL